VSRFEQRPPPARLRRVLQAPRKQSDDPGKLVPTGLSEWHRQERSTIHGTQVTPHCRHVTLLQALAASATPSTALPASEGPQAVCTSRQ
jgi:hypothetical protein